MSSPLKADPGLLIAFEGLDQSGKQTQAELLRDRLTSDGRSVRLLSFPDYQTAIGGEIGRGLRGEREYTADVMQLLYVANRYERKPDLERWLDGGLALVCAFATLVMSVLAAPLHHFFGEGALVGVGAAALAGALVLLRVSLTDRGGGS